jgi:MFS family permease
VTVGRVVRWGVRRPGWLSRTLVVLTLVSLTQDAASELLYPLLPLLLTGVLAAPPVVLGVVEGAAELAAGLSRYVAGRWSDRAGRKVFIGAGYGLAAVGKAVVAAAAVWPVVLVGRVVDRLGKGVRGAPRDALVAASVPPEALGRAFGFHRAGDTLGAVVGPLLGLLALAITDDLRTALWWAVAPAVLSALLVLLVREERPVAAPFAAPVAAAAGAPVASRGVGRSPLPASFWRVAAVLAGIALVNFPDTLVLLRVSQLGLTTTQVVLAYVLFNVVYALASYPAGRLTDDLPRPVVYGVGLVAFAVAYTGLGLVDGGVAVWVLVAVYGLFPAFTDGVGKAWVSRIVPDAVRGRAQGVFQGMSGVAILLAGLWAGLLWDVGPGQGVVPLVASGAIGGVCALGLLTRGRMVA